LVKELTGWGALERTEEIQYRLGRRLFELGSRVPTARALRDIAMPFLEDLHYVTGSIVHLAVLEETEVLYLERLAGHDPAPAPSRVGGRNPAHCTGVGKAMLAYSNDQLVMRSVLRGLKPLTGRTIVVPQLLVKELTEIRRSGVAVDREEIQPGLTCVASPILDANGQAVAGVSVSDRVTQLKPNAVIPALKACARGISRAIQSQSEVVL
jgi:DNA-binding IclR family transcriptional regulator